MQARAEAAVAIYPKFVIPMHPLDTHSEESKKMVEEKPRINVVMPVPGEKFEIE